MPGGAAAAAALLGLRAFVQVNVGSGWQPKRQKIDPMINYSVAVIGFRVSGVSVTKIIVNKASARLHVL